MAKSSRENTDPLEALFGDIFLKLMNGMIKADSVEAKFPKLGARLKTFTEARMRRVANSAGRYYAQHANPSPQKLTKGEVANLQMEAIEFALEELDNEKDDEE